MASISVAGDSSGSITIAAPAVAGSGTLTLPVATDTLVGKATTDTLTNKSIAATQLTGTIAAARLPAGSVLQVVNATYNTEITTASATYSDTGLTATITPTSVTSKILVLLNHNGCRKSAAADTRLGIKLLRAGSAIVTVDEYVAWTGSTASSAVGSSSLSYLDSPATTSATIYKTQYNNVNAAGTTFLQVGNATSTITLMEIAG